MPTTLKGIAEMLASAGVNHSLDEKNQCVFTGYGMQDYRAPDGSPVIRMFLVTEEGGAFVRVVAPFLYVCQTKEYFRAVMEVCNATTRRFKLIRCEFNPENGAVSIEVHLAVQDSALTSEQLLRMLGVVTVTVEECDASLRTACESGEVIEPEDQEAIRREFEEFRRQRRARRETPVTVGLEE